MHSERRKKQRGVQRVAEVELDCIVSEQDTVKIEIAHRHYIHTHFLCICMGAVCITVLVVYIVRCGSNCSQMHALNELWQ